MEFFFGLMKDHLDFNLYQSFDEIEYAIAQFIDYYNNRRSQWNLKKLTPTKCSDQLFAF